MKYAMVLATVIMLAHSAVSAEPRSADKLVELYKRCHAEKNITQMMSLYCQDGTPDFILKFHRADVEGTLKATIESAKLTPIPTEEKTKCTKGFPYKGKTIVPNISPIQQMVVVFKKDDKGKSGVDGQTIMIGKQNGNHYFVLSRFKDEE